MVYSPTSWVNDEAPAINSSNLQHIETGIDEAHDHMASSTNPHGVQAGVKVLKAKGNDTTASFDDTETAIIWTTGLINTTTTVSVSSDDISINTSGIYGFSVSIRTDNSNRTELEIRTYIDTGGGYVQDTDEIVSDYVSRDSDQDKGGVTLDTIMKVSSSTGWNFQFRGFGDTDGSSVLLKQGTRLLVTDL